MKTFLIVLAMLLTMITGGCASEAAKEPKEDKWLTDMLSGRAPLTLSDKQVKEMQKSPLGTKENPVRTEGVEGEYRYLARLRCPEGKPPVVDRIGSAADRSPYGSIVDIYNVVCDAPPSHRVLVDMYHPGYVESAAVPGFTIVAAEGN